jgi:predicted short-subunit dehydrogenase-like oxidoreductase (DUF2520 family)
LAISDDAILPMAAQLAQLGDIPIVHTSGATPMNVFRMFFKRYGIFYPLQTFSIDKEVDFEQVPINIDSNEAIFKTVLGGIAQSITPHVYYLDDEQRKNLHVAAVFVNNFTNAMFQAAHEICAREGLPFQILMPLIAETMDKIKTLSPKEAQTGPAIRKDYETIDRHLEYLRKYPLEYFSVYRIMSEFIMKQSGD